MNISNLTTEKRNPKTENLDHMTALAFCQIMNEEDHLPAEAVKEAIPQIAASIDEVARAIQAGGRLIYIGAGTSGRLGVLDASECVPTFSVPYGLVMGIMAGGSGAFGQAVEGIEDSREQAVLDLQEAGLSDKDVVIGVAASGRTPYVVSALEYAAKIGAVPISLSCNKGSEIAKHAKIAIEADAGPEILSGSTRLKAGTVQKLVMNMISTGAMVQCGKVYKNLMVDMSMSNEKLRDRGRRIIMEATGISAEEADSYLDLADGKIKAAIVMVLAGCGLEEAQERLEKGGGFVRKAI